MCSHPVPHTSYSMGIRRVSYSCQGGDIRIGNNMHSPSSPSAGLGNGTSYAINPYREAHFFGDDGEIG